MNDKKIMPSLLSADFYNLENDITKLKEAGINEIHYDVMDGTFVPAISFGHNILNQLAGKQDMKYDVHLMVNDPVKQVPNYINDNVTGITWHLEAGYDSDHKELINELYNWNPKIKKGMSIKPKTNVEQLYEFMPKLDIVLVMSVEPGAGGQPFIPKSIDKIKKLREYITKFNLDTKIYVDGGVNLETAKQCFEAGADYLVAGSYIFKSTDWSKTIKGLTDLYE